MFMKPHRQPCAAALVSEGSAVLALCLPHRPWSCHRHPSTPRSGGSWGWRHPLHAAGKLGNKGYVHWRALSFTLLRGELASIATCNSSPTIASSFHTQGGEPSNLTEISLALHCSEVDPNPIYAADRLKTSSGEKGGGGKKNF